MLKVLLNCIHEKKSIAILVVLILFHTKLFAQFTQQEQKQIDSLNNILKNKSSHDTAVIKAYLDLGEVLAASNIDTVIYISQKAREKILDLLTNEKNPQVRKSLKISLAQALNNIGYVHMNKVNLPLALEYYKKSIVVEEENGNIKGLASAYNNIGLIYFNKGDIPQALEYYHKSLKIKERFRDKKGMAYSYNNLGFVYNEQGNYPLALDYYKKSLRIREEIGDKNGMAMSFNNIGQVHHKQGEVSLALEYYNKSFKIREETNDKKGMAYVLSNIGLIHYENNELIPALDCFKKGLIYYKEIGDQEGMSYSYHRLGSLFMKKGDLVEARKNAAMGLDIAKEIGYPAIIELNARLLCTIASKQGNWKEAFEMRNLEIKMRDSLESIANIRAAANQEAKYKYDKKAATDSIAHVNEIKIKDLQFAKVEQEREKQRVIIYSFIAGFIVILTFSFIVFRLFLQKKKANIIIANKNLSLETAYNEISSQKEEITSQRDEIEAQRDKLSNQNLILEEQKKEITDSIHYAKRIQNALLPSGELALKILGEHFILFKPKDIVSGDFYWGTRINKWLIVAVADCTGHGVPGAFMSMLGVSFLNEIVRKKEITKASEILNYLRNSVIDALQQKGKPGEQKDGMDISMLVINTETNECQWAGANNPLYIVSSQQSPVGSLFSANCQLPTGDCRLFELKGDKMPIAIYPEMKDFTNHEFNLQKNDCVYLFTDGYADQFGGPKGRKFMYKQFKETLLDNSKNSMSEQKVKLENSFNYWIKNSEQIDDVTVLGIRI